MPWCMSSPRWSQPGMRRAAAESEGEADGRPTEVLITGILARCWAGEINLQRFSHCSNCWLMLDSSAALSLFSRQATDTAAARSHSAFLSYYLLIFAASCFIWSLSLRTLLPPLVFMELAGNKGRILWSAFSVRLSFLPWALRLFLKVKLSFWF